MYCHVIYFYQRKVDKKDASLFQTGMLKPVVSLYSITFCAAGMETAPSWYREYLLKITALGFGGGLLNGKFLKI